jgi:hypothetical protein
MRTAALQVVHWAALCRNVPVTFTLATFAHHMFGETHKLKYGRAISFCDFGKKHDFALFQFHGTPGSRITGLIEEMVVESGFRIVEPANSSVNLHCLESLCRLPHKEYYTWLLILR